MPQKNISGTAKIAYTSPTCIGINWNLEDVGFGELNFYKVNGVWKLETETMGKKIAKQILGILVDQLELID